MTASLYVAVSEYQRPLVEVDALRDAHWAWLQHQYDRGSVLVSGRREPPVGGVIVAAAPSPAALEALLAEDPFVRAGVARYEVIAFAPAPPPLRSSHAAAFLTELRAADVA